MAIAQLQARRQQCSDVQNFVAITSWYFGIHESFRGIWIMSENIH